MSAEDILAALRRVSLSVELWRSAFARQHGIAGSDSLVLSELAQSSEPLVPKDLARLLAIQSGTLTFMLDRLERAGFIVRAPNPSDRRSSLIELTAHGRQVMSSGAAVLCDLLAERIPTKDHARVAAILNQIADISATVVSATTAHLDTAERSGPSGPVPA